MWTRGDGLEASALAPAVGRTRDGASGEVVNLAVRGIPEEKLAHQIARELNPYEGARCTGRSLDDHGTLYDRWGDSSLAEVVSALKTADALDVTREALGRAEKRTENIQASLTWRERDLAAAMRRAGQREGASNAYDIDERLDGAVAFRSKVEDFAAKMPRGFGGAVKALGGGLGSLLGYGDGALAKAQAQREARLAADPEVAEIRRGVEMLRDRLERAHMNEADLSARLERLENRVKRSECDVDPAEFDERMREAGRTLGAAAEQLKPLAPEIKAFVGAQVDGAPREEIARLADALERRCRAEFGVSAAVAVESLAASQAAERTLRASVATATTRTALDDYGDRLYDEWAEGGRRQFGTSDSIQRALAEMNLSPERPVDTPSARPPSFYDLAEVDDFGEPEAVEQTVEDEVPEGFGGGEPSPGVAPKPRGRSRGRRGRGKGK